MGILNNMGGNIPDGNFLGGNFPGVNSPGGSLIGGDFPGRKFPDTDYTTPLCLFYYIFSNVIVQKY